ncbi:MAG: formate/nitrite transporter family protein, partial [Lachnospiraceae bacterium]|nr:formate/nitrite transporter family protein [Lachnospiraceae bacterium]
MFKNEYEAMVGAAEGKLAFLSKNPLGYFCLSMLAGAYIGFGVILSNTIGQSLSGEPIAKLFSGLTFGVALSLVVICGGELFTGNNMVLFGSVLTKKRRFSEVLKLWCVCWIGNLLGAVILGCIYTLTGYGAGPVGEFMSVAAETKMSAGAVQL